MKLRPFELALVIVFGGLALLSLILLTVYKPEVSQEESLLAAVGTVDIWGTLPATEMYDIFTELKENNPLYERVTYRYVSPDSFDNALVNALADGVGPDLVLVSHEKLAALRGRIQPLSYESVPKPDIQNLYLDGAQIYALSDGFYGYPVAVDPMVLYWNKDILSTNGYLAPPATWESLVNTMFPTLISRESDRTITRSVVAMGEYGNVRNGYGLLSALLMQGGTRGVTEKGGVYTVQLQTSVSSDTGDPLRAALGFYTQFSKSSNVLYSWNRSLPDDRKQFVSGDLVFYFGYGSEAQEIERLNPNLNFAVAEIPQDGAATVRRTYGKYYALSPLKSSDNLSGALVMLRNIASQAVSNEIAVRNHMVPVYRSLVSSGSNDIYGRLLYTVAPVSYAWLNPDKARVDDAFKTAVEDINENRRTLDSATRDFSARISGYY